MTDEAPKNERSVLLVANSDPKAQPLIILFPQWSKAAIDKLPRARALELYEAFTHVVSAEWERLMRAGPDR